MNCPAALALHAYATHAGVSDAMVGMKVGETREIQLTLPDNFEPAALRGCPVTCRVGITDLFEYELAEVRKTASQCLSAFALRLSFTRHTD